MANEKCSRSSTPHARTSNRLAPRNIIPHPIFDTQVAAMVLGHGDSISYDQLVQRITGDTLTSRTLHDWTRRPLSAAQTTIIRTSHLLMSTRVSRYRSAADRRMDDEMESSPRRTLSRRRSGPGCGEDAVASPRSRHSDRGAAWREREAQTRDVPARGAQGRHHR